jgi:ABC-type lipoprotein export system ATPase subunit
MNIIRFNNVIPQVFASIDRLDSEVWGQDITFERGNIYLVEAASGKGKSTFCSYISGYRHDYSGQILFDETDIKTYNSKQWSQLRQRHISLLFQELRLFPELTALENVQIKNQLTEHLDTNIILDWFRRLGIEEKINQQLSKMSFGQQQRVAMIRSLSQPFDILLADEPISHLDDVNADAMADIMIEAARQQNACVIVTSIGKHMNIKYDKVIKL